jgi:predicted MPP superfamily phosphohydrolase
MKKSNLIIIFILSFLSLYGQDKTNYIGLGFYSVCCGTPSGEKVFDYIKLYKKENRITVIKAILITGQGKEGEHTYLLKLEELNKKQRKYFIMGLKKVLISISQKGDSGGINLIENLDRKTWENQIQTNRIKSLKVNL